MDIAQEVFAIKLYELEQQYGKLQTRLRLCGKESHRKIREELQKVKDEYEESHPAGARRRSWFFRLRPQERPMILNRLPSWPGL